MLVKWFLNLVFCLHDERQVSEVLTFYGTVCLDGSGDL